MTQKQKTVLGFAAGVTAGVSYGLNPLFGKPLLDGGVPVLSLLFFRYAISAVILGLWMAFRHESFRVNGREMRLLVVLGCLFAASSVFLFESYRFIPSGLATTFVYLYPVFVALIMVGLHVYPKWQVWLSIAATSAVLNLIGLAIFPTMIAMLTIALSTRLIGPTKTSVLGAFEPVTAILVGTLVFGEPLTVNILAGIVICIAAVLFMILSEK